jgi:hypothetical protein
MSTPRGRVAIAALVVALVFGATFAVRKATAGSSQAAALPAPLVVTSTPVHVSGFAPPATPPALRHPPHPSAPPPASTPPPATTPAPSSTQAPAPSTPSQPTAPPSSGKHSGPVLVG